jgi:uncharacterized protein
MHIVCAIVIGLIFAASSGHAASFDCDKKLSAIEESICEDQELSELDEILMRTYKLVLPISPNKDALRKGQRQWLTTVRNRCTSSDCLLKVYSARVQALEAIWEKTALQARGAPSEEKPFEGRWEHCQIYRGEEICSSYDLVQQGAHVCGLWEYWATNKIYSGQLQAAIKKHNHAELKLICGRLGSETSTECDNSVQPTGAWEKAKGRLSVCNGKLYDRQSSASCAPINQAHGFLYRPLADKERESLFSQVWLRACLRDG